MISGSLDEAFVSVPTVAADGRIYVAFLNTTDLTTGRDDYEVVEVSPATGARVAGPFKVATTIDGFTDYPIAFGRQTYEDSLFRSWAAGNITADPTERRPTSRSSGRTCATASCPAPEDPYEADDELGRHRQPVVRLADAPGRRAGALALPTTSSMPWGAYDTAGRLRIGFFDRAGDAANHTYGYTLATETAAGSLAFATTELTTVRSDPTKGNRWFAGDARPGLPVRDDVPRRLLRHRRDPRAASSPLDRPPQRRDVRGRDAQGPGHVLRRCAVAAKPARSLEAPAPVGASACQALTSGVERLERLSLALDGAPVLRRERLDTGPATIRPSRRDHAAGDGAVDEVRPDRERVLGAEDPRPVLLGQEAGPAGVDEQDRVPVRQEADRRGRVGIRAAARPAGRRARGRPRRGSEPASSPSPPRCTSATEMPAHEAMSRHAAGPNARR